MNINSDPLPVGPYDLVVNHAAAHHVMRLDRVFRDLCSLLPPEGWFISLDYVGPHRNQYSLEAWSEAWKLNEQLPSHLRQVMAYPLIDVFLSVDPTEAVHSELILETVHRYFSVAEFVPLGGALAYPVLTHNAQMFSAEVDPDERELWGQVVLDHDAAYLEEHPHSNLFAYFSAQPNKEILTKEAELVAWRTTEDLREAHASEGDGTYYDRSFLNALYWELATLRSANSDLERELDTIRSSYLYSHLTRVLGLPVVRRILQSRSVRLLRRSQDPQIG
jgi:SAM-dependent methyltransferase